MYIVRYYNYITRDTYKSVSYIGNNIQLLTHMYALRYIEIVEGLYMEQITTLLLNTGSTVVILAYFIYRDIKFMQKLESTLDVIMQLVKIERKGQAHESEE